MDWALCISRNRAALAAIVAGLLAMMRCASGGPMARGVLSSDAAGSSAILPRPVRRAVLRILRPAESALRRLIVIAAGQLNCRMGPRVRPEDDDREQKPLPDFASFGPGTGVRAPSFRLIDPRKRFVFAPARPAPVSEPRIWVLGGGTPAGTGPLLSAFASQLPAGRQDHSDTDAPAHINATALIRRVEAMEHALKRLPAQARRLNRLMARRAAPPSGRVTKRKSSLGPMRPGWPPGHRTRVAHPVDAMLHDLHALALDMHDPPRMAAR